MSDQTVSTSAGTSYDDLGPSVAETAARLIGNPEAVSGAGLLWALREEVIRESVRRLNNTQLAEYLAVIAAK
jgi:hypothetical protein